MTKYSGVGLCGSHRTGKTTTAKKLAHDNDIPFVETTTSAVFAEHGLKPSSPMDFSTRLWIQDKVLAAAEEIWAQHRQFITDRTPLDMLAYTLGDIQGRTQVEFAALEHYVERCFAATNQYFGHLCVVQPGIPLIAAPGKAALNDAYIEHLNTLVLGLCLDERQQVPFAVMPRNCIAITERCLFIEEKCFTPL